MLGEHVAGPGRNLTSVERSASHRPDERGAFLPDWVVPLYAHEGFSSEAQESVKYRRATIERAGGDETDSEPEGGAYGSGSDTAESTDAVYWVTANDGTADTGGTAYSAAGTNGQLVVMVVDAPNDTMVARRRHALISLKNILYGSCPLLPEFFNDPSCTVR